jgi:AP-1 complex subunit beta-1
MKEEDLNVQLQVLNTAVKIYVNHPQNFLEQLSNLFKTASEFTDNPDLRDRAFIYWRLLNLNDLELAKEIIIGEKPQIDNPEDNTVPVSADLTAQLIGQMGMITSVLWDSEENLNLDIIEL